MPAAELETVTDRDRVIEAVLANPVNRAILQHGPALELPDWWLTGGAIFQTVWNVMDGRDPAAGIEDYDLFYYDDADLSRTAEETVQDRCSAAFGDLAARVEASNQARVHLWYESHFGVPGRTFRSSTDAIDDFVSTTCCFAVTRDPVGRLRLYAPHGCSDLFAQRLVPNPRLDSAQTYRRKAARWVREWPGLTVEPWPMA